ncbi:MAG: hypothetical protein V2G48_06925 [bacterium JZ-2024 1]
MRVWLKTKRGAIGVFPPKEARGVSALQQIFPTVDGEIEVPVVSYAQMDAFEVFIGADAGGAYCNIRMVTHQFLQWEDLDCPVRIFVEDGNGVKFIGFVKRMEVLPGKIAIRAEGMR